MPIQFKKENGGKILIVHASGKLTKSDYEYLILEVDRLIQLYGTLHVLVDITAFHGWESDALWEDIKFDALWKDIKCSVKHFGDIERLTIVGDKQWQEVLALFAKPFTKAAIHYFNQSDTTEARQWLDD